MFVWRRGQVGEEMPSRVTPVTRGMSSSSQTLLLVEDRGLIWKHAKVLERTKLWSRVTTRYGNKTDSAGEAQQRFTRPTDRPTDQQLLRRKWATELNARVGGEIWVRRGLDGGLVPAWFRPSRGGVTSSSQTPPLLKKEHSFERKNGDGPGQDPKTRFTLLARTTTI
jgi:hypothetical protein